MTQGASAAGLLRHVEGTALSARLRVLAAALLLAAPAAGVLVSAPAPQDAPQAPARRVVVLSIDAGADWIADKLIAEGKAPALAAMARDGAHATAMITVVPSLTAVSHASLWTGAFPRVTGVAGNSVPRSPSSEHTLLERRSGYLSDVLEAEPIWMTAARAGKRALVVQATGAYPFPPGHRDRLTQFDVYANVLLRGGVVRAVAEGGRYAFRIGDTEAVITALDGTRLRLAAGGATAVIDPSGPVFSPPFAAAVNGRVGQLRLGVLEFDPETGALLLLRGDVMQLTSTHAEQLVPFQEAAGIALGEAATRPYMSGEMGATIAAGGNGAAERHLTQALFANQDYFDGALRYAETRRWDLLVLYVPNMDVAGHALGGMIAPDSPAYRAEIAARVWPVYEAIFKRCADDYVAAVRRRFPDATLVVAADHGVEGTARILNVNTILRDAGLLGETARGSLDLSTTKALYFNAHSADILVNSTRWKGGIVPEEDRPSVKQAVAKALLAARDPDTDAPLIRAVFDTDLDGEGLGVGGPMAGDLYFDPAPGYEALATLGRPAVVETMPPGGAGIHGPMPWRRRLHAIFFAAGPGVAAGARPGLVRTVDVAPTVARLLGIPKPAQAEGRVIPLDR